MAEVTVSELAGVVGASVERLLTQMKEAGLPQTLPDAVVSDEEKQTLLVYLKGLHGEKGSAPKKITLRRKTVGTLKAGAGRKSVNVEVRKKRTYIKKDAEEVVAEPETVAESLVSAELEPEAEISETPVPEVLAEVAPEEVAPEVVEPEPVTEAEPEPEIAVEPEVVAEPEAAAESEVVTEPEAPVEAVVGKPAAPRRPLHTPSRLVDDVEAKRIASILARKEREKIAKQELEQRKLDKAQEEEDAKARLEAERVAKAKPAGEAKTESPLARLGRVREKPAEEEEKKTKRKKTLKGSRKKRPEDLIKEAGLDRAEARRKGPLRSSSPAVKVKNVHVFQKPTDKVVHEVEIGDTIVVSELASKMALKANVVIKALMKMGTMLTINDSIDHDTAALITEELGHRPVVMSDGVEDELREMMQAVQASAEEARAPVVTVMGHVDHGKTSLLDYIRESRVASGEAGGITQHIGAYHVDTPHGMVTFLDTPGHAAFTAMRARGAKSTDVVILIVAADDGVMPQTEEAILHAKAAGVPIIVAINKMDKEGADPERVTSELAAKDVIPEEWGGDTQFVKVSAHTGEGIDTLLEAVLLQAELLELSAPTDGVARGVIVESRVAKGRGVVATALVQAGTLRKGDYLLAGGSVGKIRAMSDEAGKAILEAGPSIPVEILGLDIPPNAGDDFAVVSDERKAKEVAQARQQKERDDRVARQKANKLENMFAGFEGTEKKILPVLVKADVRGSLEAILSSLAEIGNDEVAVNVINFGIGGLTESDINLAATSGAVVVGFNVRAEVSGRRLAEAEGIEIRYYSVIYNLLDDIKDALSGMLDPEIREEIVGIAEVKEVFSSPKFGQIAGSIVTEGTIYRNKPIRVLRDSVVIYEGELESLRRFKDDVNDVRSGTECGIGVKDYTDVKPGDQIEVFDVKEIERSL
ncbi:MAG: translation initiation factor IF-2 [Gammaproteobacteria bacterium]|nr:translation initiation factor IF-2 [Gammaproteobacteria bacterium]MBQ0840011.1 translation initiation factor IF-2 [Gammaproteobacteria bacterium]